MTQNLPPALQDKRVLMGAGGVLLIIIVAVIILFVVNAGKNLGPFKPLLKGIDQVRGVEICSYLKTGGIEYEMVQGETGGVEILVREKQYDDAVLRLAGNQILKNDDLGLFDKTDWAASDEERRVKLIRAISGEVSRVISRMEGVKSATAHINIPARKLFRSNGELASASVYVEMKPGRALSDEQVSSIISLIRGYYAEIRPNHVSISDDKRVYAEISDEEDGLNGSVNGIAKIDSERSSVERRIQNYLDSLFGQGRATAVVSISLDNSKVIENDTTFTPGAIGTHEYKEEAIGDPARQAPFRGVPERSAEGSEEDYMMPNASAPSPVPSPSPSVPNPGDLSSTPMINAPSGPTSYNSSISDPFAPPSSRPSGASPSPYSPSSDSLPNFSSSSSPTKTQDIAFESDEIKRESAYYDLRPKWEASERAVSKELEYSKDGKNAAIGEEDSLRKYYKCSPGDEACDRDYRQHNFLIQSYPSYKQTKTERPPGGIRSTKVSVIIDQEALSMTTSITNLKRGIAAAADPEMPLGNVEIITRNPSVNDGLDQENSSGKDFWSSITDAIAKILGLGSPRGDKKKGRGFPFLRIIGTIGGFIVGIMILGWILGAVKAAFRSIKRPDPYRGYGGAAIGQDVQVTPVSGQTQAPQSRTDFSNRRVRQQPLSSTESGRDEDIMPSQSVSREAGEEIPFDLDDEFSTGFEIPDEKPQTQNSQSKEKRPPAQPDKPRMIIEDD